MGRYERCGTALTTPEGIAEEEIAEALGVGISVNAGAAIVYSTRTLDAFDAATRSDRAPCCRSHHWVFGLVTRVRELNHRQDPGERGL